MSDLDPISEKILAKLDAIHEDFGSIKTSVAVHSTQINQQTDALSKMVGTIEALDARVRHVETQQIDVAKLNELEARLREVEKSDVVSRVYTGAISGVCAILGTGLVEFLVYKVLDLHHVAGH